MFYSQPVVQFVFGFTQIRLHLHPQTSCLRQYSPAKTDVRFDHQLSQNSESYKANLSSLEKAHTFYSTLCLIKFSI